MSGIVAPHASSVATSATAVRRVFERYGGLKHKRGTRSAALPDHHFVASSMIQQRDDLNKPRFNSFWHFFVVCVIPLSKSLFCLYLWCTGMRQFQSPVMKRIVVLRCVFFVVFRQARVCSAKLHVTNPRIGITYGAHGDFFLLIFFGSHPCTGKLMASVCAGPCQIIARVKQDVSFLEKREASAACRAYIPQ